MIRVLESIYYDIRNIPLQCLILKNPTPTQVPCFHWPKRARIPLCGLNPLVLNPSGPHSQKWSAFADHFCELTREGSGASGDSNAGAMPSELARPRGGAQAEASDGEPRAAGESHRLRQEN